MREQVVRGLNAEAEVRLKRSKARGAVNKCTRRYLDAYKEAKARGSVMASYEAGEAYKAAMPIMDSRESTHAYVACVAHGLAAGFISGQDASKMLYAAQVALSATQARQRPEKARVA